MSLLERCGFPKLPVVPAAKFEEATVRAAQFGIAVIGVGDMPEL